LPSKDLTWNLFGRDVSASGAFKKLADDVKSSTDRASKDVDKFDANNKKASEKGSGLGLLTTAILAIGPAAVPLAGVAAGLGAGFAAAGAVAVVGILGIKDEMKNGTVIGKQYTAGVATMNVEFVKLKQLAAAGMLSGFQASIKALQPMFPALNRDVALFSSQLGTVAGHVAPSLVSLFHGLNPLFVTFGNLLVEGSAKLQAWAGSSQSVGKFVAYAQNELPGVMHTLGALTETVSHLVMGFAPLGSATITSLGLLATAINAIPVSTLQTLLPVITATVLALKGMKIADQAATSMGNAASKVQDLGLGFKTAGSAIGMASIGLRTMGVVGLAAGPILGLLVGWLGKQKQAQQEATANVNDYTQAMLASNLAIDANVRGAAAKKLSDEGLFDVAKRLGVSQSDLTDAVLGVGHGMDIVKGAIASGSATLDGMQQEALTTGKSLGELGLSGSAQQLTSDLEKLSAGTQAQTNEFQKGAKAAADQKLAIDRVAASQGISAATAAANAKAMGITAQEYLLGSAAAAKNATNVDKQTQAMRFANDAAGLLKQSFDALNGVVLGVDEANTAFYASVLSLTDGLKQNGKSLDLNTQEGIANNQAVEAAIKAAQAHAEAVSGGTKLTAAGTTAYRNDLIVLRDRIKAVGGNTSAIQALIDKYGIVPKVVNTTVEAHTAAANAMIAATKANLQSIANKRVRIDGEVHGLDAANSALDWVARTRLAVINVVQNTGEKHGADAARSASGSTVTGIGTSTSDSNPYMLSVGEEIINAKQAAKYRPLLKAINAGQPLPPIGNGGGGVPTTHGQSMAMAGGMNEKTLTRAFRAALDGAAIKFLDSDGTARRGVLLARGG
jgi:hypothetical protein